ncbi:MAG TPA: RNA polymerase sigma factor [Solirubrobacteraceae bacterium]|nr:RNA polymerase sigma factor [Solirubrobacteraceae bacterium]
MDVGSDDDLLAAADRDGAAYTAFYLRYERAMLAFFLRGTHDAELAADLTAEVFAAVLLACRRYRPGAAPASAWLFAIAQNKLADSRRRGRVEDAARRRLGMAPLELDDEDLRRVEACAGADALLETLLADERAAVRARVLDEQSYEEIAGRLECSQAVVRKRVSRGLARLRSQLGEEGM